VAAEHSQLHALWNGARSLWIAIELPIGPGNSEHLGGAGLDADTRRNLEDSTTIAAPVRPVTVMPHGAAARFPPDFMDRV